MCNGKPGSFHEGFGSRSGFQISPDTVLKLVLNPDPGTKKECRKGVKSDLSEENLKL